MIIESNIQENVKKLDALLLEELKEKTGKTDRNERRISLAAQEGQTYMGGLVADVMFESCYIDLLAVKKEFRGKGIASKLLKELEKMLSEAGIRILFLNTQDYQAKDFYLKLGFTIAGEMKDVPFAGTTRYFLYKNVN